MEVYTNDLHNALFVFWQCWHSNFESNTSCKLIEGCVDADVTAAKFASHFTSVFSCNDPQKANSIKQDYVTSRANYCGLPHNIDTELVSTVVSVLRILRMERLYI